MIYHLPEPMGWIRPQTAPTFLFFFILSISSLTDSGLKSTSPSSVRINVFSACKSDMNGYKLQLLVMFRHFNDIQLRVDHLHSRSTQLCKLKTNQFKFKKEHAIAKEQIKYFLSIITINEDHLSLL